MKRTGLTILALAALFGAVAPRLAHADSGFSLRVESDSRRGHYDRDHGGWHGRSRGHDYEWRRGHYYRPSYHAFPAYPPYVTTYIAPPPMVYAPPATSTIIMTAPTLPANQTSPTYTDEAGRTCREYQSTVIVGDQQQQAYGTACLQPDGTWRVTQ